MITSQDSSYPSSSSYFSNHQFSWCTLWRGNGLRLRFQNTFSNFQTASPTHVLCVWVVKHIAISHHKVFVVVVYLISEHFVVNWFSHHIKKNHFIRRRRQKPPHSLLFDDFWWHEYWAASNKWVDLICFFFIQREFCIVWKRFVLYSNRDHHAACFSCLCAFVT